MIRCIIILITFSIASQVQAFSIADITGEWEWLGDSTGRYPNPDSAIKTSETHILLFRDKTDPKVRYIAENRQICSDCSGSYGLISTKNGNPVFKYSGEWTLSADLIVIKRKAINYNIAGALQSEALRVSYDKDKKILALGTLVNNVGRGNFSYYKKRPDSVTSMSPYYATIKDKFVNNVDIGKIKLGMTPKSIINNIKDNFVISDVVKFSKGSEVSPYIEKITAVRENDTRIDKYTFDFAKPPYANRLQAIHRSQQFLFKDNMERLPPALKNVKNILIKKYGQPKTIAEVKNDVNGEQKHTTISWFNKPGACNTQFKHHSQKPPCPLLFDAQLSSFSTNHRKYPNIVNSLELHLINYPEIVQNEEAIHQQKTMHKTPKIKMKEMHNKKSLEFEL